MEILLWPERRRSPSIEASKTPQLDDLDFFKYYLFVYLSKKGEKTNFNEYSEVLKKNLISCHRKGFS